VRAAANFDVIFHIHVALDQVLVHAEVIEHLLQLVVQL